MTPKLNDDLAKALDEQGGKITVQHPSTGEPVIVIVSQRLDEELRQAFHEDEQSDIAAVQAGIDAASDGRDSTLAETDSYIRRKMNFPTAE